MMRHLFDASNILLFSAFCILMLCSLVVIMSAIMIKELLTVICCIFILFIVVQCATLNLPFFDIGCMSVLF